MRLRRFKKYARLVLAVAFSVNVAYAIVAIVPVTVGVLHLAPIEEHHS